MEPIEWVVGGLILLAIAFSSSSCDDASDEAEAEGNDGDAPGSEGCNRCHIAPDDPPPFRPLYSANDEVILDGRHPLAAVGAHDKHIGASSIIARQACATCHHVPMSVWGDPRHIDNGYPGYDKKRAEVEFSSPELGLPGALPSYDPQGMSCTLYCHSTLATEHSPSWNAEVPPDQAGCAICHDPEVRRTPGGIPTHPENTTCSQCHTATAKADDAGLQVINDLTKHLDRQVDVDAGAITCNACHDFRTAPAAGDPGYAITYWHWRHVGEGRPDQLASPVSCNDCHSGSVPTLENFSAMTTHGDGQVQVAFSGAAIAPGAAPAYDPATKGCSTTACHDRGGDLPAPTVGPNPEARECDACHGSPPVTTTPPAHVNSTNCNVCHEKTVAPATNGQGQVIADFTKHVDGNVQVGSLECATCHGEIRTGISAARHALHEVGGNVANGAACGTCHTGHGDDGADEAAHPDGALQVIFSGAAAQGGFATSFDAADASCTTYCHNGSEGGVLAGSSWRSVVDYVSGECNGCHSSPPQIDSHPAAHNCQACHLPVAGADAEGDLSVLTRALHIDGTKTTAPQNCSSCHEGLQATRPDSEALHGIHSAGSSSLAAMFDPILCGTCHTVPGSPDADGHLTNLEGNPPFNPLEWLAEINFSGKAQGGSYDVPTKSCSQVGCHSVPSSPGSRPVPQWNLATPVADECGMCHNAAPPERHQTAEQCTPCHDQTAGPNRTIANTSSHGNLTVDTNANLCTACHTPGDAHTAHTTPSFLLPAPLSCTECHGTTVQTYAASIWTATHMDGAPNFGWGPIATAGGHAPSYDAATATCSNTGCHDRGGFLPAPQWNGGADAGTCGACHGIPPAIPPHQPSDNMMSCSKCHDTEILADWMGHVNGELPILTGAALCTSCHGLPPPPDHTGSNAIASPGVGQHAVHSALYSCTTCHGAMPATILDHSPRDGQVQIQFSGLAVAGGAAPTYNAASRTCSSVYCHGGTMPGGTFPIPQWTDASGQISASCTSCHGQPPPDPTHEIWDILQQAGVPMTCGDCHGAVFNPDGTFQDESLHINGGVEGM